MTRTESRRHDQSELDRMSLKVRTAPRGEINAWRKWQVKEVAKMLKADARGGK